MGSIIFFEKINVLGAEPYRFLIYHLDLTTQIGLEM
jgi:hypothetical protein